MIDERETMAGIIHKIEETLHMGGKKKEDQQQGEQHKAGGVAGGEHKVGEYQGEHKAGEYHGEHKAGDQHQGEHKEGIVEKIKDKIHGGKGEGEGQEGKKNGEGHDGHRSSSSD